jgi:hypothetical protein
MKSLDLHPDELLDKEERGSLNPSERKLLADHMAKCATCRFERCVRADFQDELAADAAHTTARPEEIAGLDSLVGDLLGRAARAPELHTSSRVSMIAPRRRLRRLGPVFAAAAALTLASLVMASSWSSSLDAVFPWRSGAPQAKELAEDGTTDADRGAVRPAPRANAAHANAASESAEENELEPAVAIAVLPPRASLDVVAVRERPAANASPFAVAQEPARVAPSATTIARAEEPVAANPAPPAPAAAAPAEPPLDASTLFARANHARTHGDHANAIRTYVQLTERFPDASEARLAHATLGRLLLDDGDAPGALRELDAYLARGDLALREEAMAGRALALQRLGRAGDEAGAWNSLLGEYPQSIHGARARERLKGIGGR